MNRLLQESNLAARQPQGVTSVIQAITGEGLAQGPYLAARGGVEPTYFRSEGTDNLHLANHATWSELYYVTLNDAILENATATTPTTPQQLTLPPPPPQPTPPPPPPTPSNVVCEE